MEITTSSSAAVADATGVTNPPPEIVAPPAPLAPPYSQRQLIHVFVWLLGGDFAFAFFEQIFSRYMPLFIKDYHGSNTLVGVMLGSVAGAVNIFFLPVVSMRSDRHRGPWGRRIPFLLWATPCTVVSLLLVGLAPELGEWIAPWVAVEKNTLVLSLLCLFAVAFHLFNMVLVNAYNWLIRDVVPGVYIGRFLSWFRVVNTLATFAFLRWAFPQIAEHRIAVFGGIGLVYTVIFLLMCWQVKEGPYPAPSQTSDNSIFRNFSRYFRECLSVPMYRYYFCAYVLMMTAGASASPFLTLFARDSLKLNMDDVGPIFAWGTLAGAVAFVPTGWACDRFEPIRVAFAGMIGMMIAPACAYLFAHDYNSWQIYVVSAAVPGSVWLLGCTALTMQLFPPRVFGQFASGLNVFGCGGLIVGNYLIGTLMDLSHSNYRLAFLWSAVLSACAIVPMTLVFRGWKEHGGPDGYVPPQPSSITS